MSNKIFLVFVMIIWLGIISFITSFFYINMANDLTDKVIKLEQEIIDYKWQLSQIDQMICSNMEVE